MTVSPREGRPGDGEPGSRPVLSVVVPMLNEAGNIGELHRRLRSVLEAEGLSHELIYVDDGSSDETPDLLRRLQAADPTVRVIILSRRFGHQRAVTAGLSFATGNAVVVMDGDLQDPPEVIPELVAGWRRGFEVVYAVRRRRPEGFPKRIAYRLFYWLLARLADVPIPLDAGDFALVDARVLRVLEAMPERNRFIRGLRAWVGFRQIGVEYDRGRRGAGETKYSFSRLVGLALDGLVSYSYAPLRFVSQMGILAFLASLVGLSYLIIGRLAGGDIPAGWTSLIVTVLFLGGLQLLALGLLGEYLGRTLEEVKRRPHFVVREALGLDVADPRAAGVSSPDRAE
jgi:glycosyltransferase involved in cell wall biosynthesis